MKKLFVFAVAAVAALAACTKVDTVNANQDQAITFQVANYTTQVQTKADPEEDSHHHTSLNDEGFTSFKAYAWYTPADGDANQPFMAPATIGYVAKAGDVDAYWHATDRTYFWPKTGYVNFFSFAGNHLPDAVDLDSTDKHAKAHYTTAMTIATDDNILIADGAYGFYNNPNAEHGLKDVAKGVPTLFRHMLSRVKFDIKVDASEVSDNKNNWSIVVNSATVSYRNQGTLEVAFPVAPSRTFDADGHPTVAGTTQQYNSQVWTPANVDNATLSKTSSTVTTNANGGAVSTAVTLIDDSVVMPQTLATTNVTIALNYTITHTYNSADPVVETVPISAKALTSFVDAITVWNPNTIYTYHIIVKPNGEVLFDPAVEVWATPLDDNEDPIEPSYTIE